MPASTYETWRQGPMGYDDEGLTDEQDHAKLDEVLEAHATQWHKDNAARRARLEQR